MDRHFTCRHEEVKLPYCTKLKQKPITYWMLKIQFLNYTNTTPHKNLDSQDTTSHRTSTIARLENIIINVIQNGSIQNLSWKIQHTFYKKKLDGSLFPMCAAQCSVWRGKPSFSSLCLPQFLFHHDAILGIENSTAVLQPVAGSKCEWYSLSQEEYYCYVDLRLNLRVFCGRRWILWKKEDGVHWITSCLSS